MIVHLYDRVLGENDMVVSNMRSKKKILFLIIDYGHFTVVVRSA